MRLRSSEIGLRCLGLVLATLVVASAPLRADSPEAEAEAATCEPSGAAAARDAERASAPEAFARANAAREALDAGRLDGIAAELEDALALGAALPARDRVRLRIHVGRSFARLADAEQGAQANAAAVRAAVLLNEAAASAAEAGELRLQAFALLYQGELYASRGRVDDGLMLTRRGLLLADRAHAGDALYRGEWQLGRLLRSQGDRAGAIVAYRRAVAQLDALRADLALSSIESAFAFREEVEPAYLELVDLLLLEAAAAAQRDQDEGDGPDTQREQGEGYGPNAQREQALLAEARDRLEALKAAELRDYFKDACLVAQRQASAEDVPGAVVLYPVVLPDRVELILSTEAGLSRHAAGVDGATLDAEAQQLRRLLAKRSTRQFMRPAQHLYDWLIRPIEAALLSDPTSTLVVVPSGALRTIPFAALHDARTGHFLIERTPIAVTPSLTLTDPRPIDVSHARGLVAALGESVQGYAALEYARPEAERVAAIFPGVKLIDQAFTVARFSDELGGTAVSVVHIASHGEFDGDPARSFVLAHDGKIPMSELGAIVAQTRLRADAPLELLVLSACQTAAGDERAALGLAGIALSAGARSALATLWSVDDAATAQLIQDFYEGLGSGTSRARALQQAQIGLLRDAPFAHPFYWAPYMLINSWL